MGETNGEAQPRPSAKPALGGTPVAELEQ